MSSSFPKGRSMDRRQFARGMSGAIATLLSSNGLGLSSVALSAPHTPDEKFWNSVRQQFSMAPDLAVMNAANLCPSSVNVIDCLVRYTKDMDGDPSFPNRAKFSDGKETVRKQLADFLRVAPEEIVITRNTSEANNLVSSGIDLKAGDEVLLFADNHPSNLDAWKSKAKRFGYTVKILDQPNPHPGAEYYIDTVRKQINGHTRVLAFTHLTSTVGDLLPARELCHLAREHEVLTLVDGAQSFGLVDIDLNEMQPDFYSGSGHKWPCGPKEVGVLYINRKSQDKIWPSIISAFPGHTGISKTFEAFGQRDEPAIMAFGEALEFQDKIGRQAIQKRAQELTQALVAGLAQIQDVKLWTHPSPERSLAVVSFQPGNLDVKKFSAALYEKNRIAGAPRLGPDRGGFRFSPHFYNLHSEIDRTLEAIQRYMRVGV